MTNQEWQMASIPQGMPKESDFKCVDIAEPNEADLKEGEVIFELKALSVDPYMRSRMTGKDTYIPGFKVGTVIEGFVAGTVSKSNAPSIKEGSSFTGFLPYRKRQVVAGKALVPAFPSEACPLTHFIGCLGMPGLTAYLALKNIAEPLKEGEYAFVSGGAGAVGSTVIQLLKAKGVKVLASAGTDEKVELCKELGAEDAFNYKTVGEGPELEKRLSEFAPKGFNVYYDNVGGRTLAAALNCMALLGRVVMCGSISQYNNLEDAYGVKNLAMITVKSLKVQGFTVGIWKDEFPEAVKALSTMYAEGKLVGKQTIMEGFDKMPAAMIGLFTGGNVGKMIVTA